MILYVDASALVKRYIAEPGSQFVVDAMNAATVVGMGLITRAETAAAIAKARRMRVISETTARTALDRLDLNWSFFTRLALTEALVAHAGDLAWKHGLRGYDAVHLAAALAWQEGLHLPVTLATFDKQLWEAAEAEGLRPQPDDLALYTRTR